MWAAYSDGPYLIQRVTSIRLPCSSYSESEKITYGPDIGVAAGKPVVAANAGRSLKPRGTTAMATW